VFAIEEQGFLLPDPIALDTSFVVEALIATQPLHAVCSAFLTRIDESGVSVATSDLLPFELAEAAFAIALKERWGGTWRRHRPDGRARRPAAQEAGCPRCPGGSCSGWNSNGLPLPRLLVPHGQEPCTA
jgi:hypothetical protein